ncbi:MAG: hypothetical protein AAFY35_15520 [Pseudomonadota bacterium]
MLSQLGLDAHEVFALPGLKRPNSIDVERMWRWVLALPGALIISILVMASFPMILPEGAGGVNHLVFPVLAFPLIWATLIILPVSSLHIRKLAMIYGGLLALCLTIIALSFVV